MQEQEKGKVSGSDEEGEGPLEQAVRKVVSYKMTPKQALQIYNLTPKVSVSIDTGKSFLLESILFF